MTTTTARKWWRRAAAALKDRSSLYLTRVVALRPSPGPVIRSAELEAAVIRATSHDERAVDYRGAARLFALARASPPEYMQPLMWALARRAGRTRCWAVALKALMLAHRLLLRSDRLGRVPFDLADFRDRSSATPSSNSSGLSAFVRAYFRFLDARSLFAAQEFIDGGANASDDADDDDARLDRVSRRQHLLALLMQIRPYGDGMEGNHLVLEAMDCVVIEIFEAYSQVCTGIARFLVSVLGSAPTTPRPRAGETVEAARRRRGALGMRVLRKAAEQSAQLSSYFELCRSLGVLNAAEFPAVERVPDDDIRDLEKLILMTHAQDSSSNKVEDKEAKALVAVEKASVASKTVVTREWVVFDENAGRQGYLSDYVNPFIGAARADSSPHPCLEISLI